MYMAHTMLHFFMLLVCRRIDAMGHEQISTADTALLKFPVVCSTSLFLLKNIQRIYPCSTEFCALFALTLMNRVSRPFPREGGEGEILETFLKIYLAILVGHSSPGVSGYRSLMTTEITRVMHPPSPLLLSVFFSGRQSTEKYSIISEQ